MADVVHCASCGYIFPEGVVATQDPRPPCPECGSLGRSGTFLEEVSIGTTLSMKWTATFDRSWRAQYRRMKRAFSRLHGVEPPSNRFVVADLEDGFVRFFQDAWHLKDWLRNDPSSSSVVTDIEAYVNSTRVLCLAADVANGSKHLSLRSTRTGDHTTDMRQAHGHGDPTIGLSATVEVESQGSRWDALVLAKQVIQAWESYIDSKGLSPT